MTSNTAEARPDCIDLPIEFVEELWPGTVITPPRGRRAAQPARAQSRTPASPTAFEVLHGAFVFLGRGARCEGAEIATPPRFGIGLARIDPILPAF